MRRSGGIVLAAALGLAACQDVPGMQNDQQAGGLLGGAAGAIGGGLLGNSFGGVGGLIGGVLGSVGGYLVGSAIGAHLDAADRQRAETATSQALAAPVPPGESGQPVAWSSDHNSATSGTAQVVGVQPQADGGQCRDVSEIAYVNGEQTRQTSRYCRGPSGAWTRQS
jgi:surface antigen